MRQKTCSFFLFIILINFSFAVKAQDARLIAKSTFPSVVMLEMRDDKDRPISLGSGFFVRPNVVVTNYHVIEGASSGFAKIVGQASIYHIEGILGLDKKKDLALLKITGAVGKPLTLADVSKIEVGEEIFALGNPRGLEGTISPGIVSGNSLRQLENESLIQITAPISPGSSGGPVVNKSGEVIGVAVSSLKEGQNLNFVIPSSEVAILLASSQNIILSPKTTRNFTEKEPSKSEPNYTDTAEWLVSKLQGKQYFTTQQSDSDVRLLHTLKGLALSKCQMLVLYTVNYYKKGKQNNFEGFSTTEMNLNSVTNVYKGEREDKKTNEKTALVFFNFNQKVYNHQQYNDGNKLVTEQTHIELPVPDLMMGERVVKAFNHLVTLCKEEGKNDPF